MTNMIVAVGTGADLMHDFGFEDLDPVKYYYAVQAGDGDWSISDPYASDEEAEKGHRKFIEKMQEDGFTLKPTVEGFTLKKKV